MNSLLKALPVAVLIFLSASFAGLLCGEPPDLCIHGACFEPVSVSEGVRLRLRSHATKRFLGFTVYDAALYLPEDFEEPERVLGPVPKKLVLRYHRSIRRDEILRASWHCLEGNPGLDLNFLRGRVDELHSLFRDVRVHDQYALVFVPGRGTELYFNGRLEGVIPGEDFQEAYFGIWLSQYPINKKLRGQLLNFAKR